MKILNNREGNIKVFLNLIKPKEEKKFSFTTPVVPVLITDENNQHISKRKLPTDVDLKINNDHLIVDDLMRMELFELPPTGISLSKILIILFVLLILCVAIYFIYKHHYLK